MVFYPVTGFDLTCNSDRISGPRWGELDDDGGADEPPRQK